MTSANKITIFRIIIIPIMIIISVIPQLNIEIENFFQITISQLIFLILFIIGSISDFLDGYIARKKNQVTTFGKFLDPIADKILVLTALMFLLSFPFWKEKTYLLLIITSTLIIVIREFLVTGVRLLAVDKGIVIAASKLGKVKTASTMITLIYMLFNGFGLSKLLFNTKLDIISIVLLSISVLLTVISGAEYLFKNRKIILESI